MKKYLSKNVLNMKTVFAFVLFGVVFSFSNLYAQTKIEYYKKLFESFDFTVYEENKNGSSEEDYLSSDPTKKGYLILLSSDIPEGKYLEGNSKIILVCDKPYSNPAPLDFTCDKSSAHSDQLENTGDFLMARNAEKIDIYVIPENSLVSLDKRNDVEDYLKALKRSDKVSLSKDEGSDGETKSMKDEVKNLFKTTTFEMFGIAVSMFVIASLSFGLLKSLSSEDKRKFDPLIFKKILLKISEFFSSHRWVTVYSLIVISIMYIPIVVTLGIKDGQGGNVGYFIAYSLDAFKIKSLANYVSQGDYSRVALFFYNSIFLIILASLFVPLVINTILVASSKIGNAKLKPRVQKYAVPSLIILSIFTSSFFEISESYRFLILVIVILSFVIINNLRFRNFDYKYSLHEKIWFVFSAFLIIVAGFMMGIREKNTDPKYKNEDLIGVTDDVVMLPYLKQMGENVFFNERLTVLSEPIFVNQYLVYSPIHSRVENKNISEFKDEGSFYIQNGDPEDMVSNINSNGNLSKILVSESPTSFFKIENFENGFGEENAQIQITFSCERKDLGVDKIKSDFYYISKDGGVEKENKTLLYFPGCAKVGEPETFTVEFSPPYFESHSFFMRLADVLKTDVKDIKIITSDIVIEPTYYLGSSGYDVIVSKGQTDSSISLITNYIFGDSYDLSFDLNPDLVGKFDISEPINELVKEGILKDNFLIWSTRKYVPIRLSD